MRYKLANVMLRIGLTLPVVSLFGVAANADTLFSNFSPADGNSIDFSTHESIGGSGFGPTKRVASPFTVSVDSLLTSVDVALSQDSDPFLVATINVGSFATPDDTQVLATSSLAAYGSPAHMVNIDFAAGAVLSPGLHYWLVLTPVHSYTTVSWYMAANTTAFGYAVSQLPTDGWLGFSATAPSLRVNGIVSGSTPEPAVPAFALALIGAGAHIRRNRRSKLR